MLLFEDYNFAFLHINKAAGTSVKEFLTEVLGSNHRKIGLELNNDNLPKTHEVLAYKIKRLQQINVAQTT